MPTTPSVNPKFCNKCNKPHCQVLITGPELREKSDSDVFDLLKHHLKPVGLVHVAKKQLHSCGLIHFDSHENASVFFNLYKSITASLGNLQIMVQPAKQLAGSDVVYSQQTLAFNEPSTSAAPVATETTFQAPAPVAAPPSLDAEPSSSRLANTLGTAVLDASATSSGWKRKQEESYALLLEDIQKKRAKMNELQKEIETMEEQKVLMRKILDL